MKALNVKAKNFKENVRRNIRTYLRTGDEGSSWMRSQGQNNSLINWYIKIEDLFSIKDDIKKINKGDWPTDGAHCVDSS